MKKNINGWTMAELVVAMLVLSVLMIMTVQTIKPKKMKTLPYAYAAVVQHCAIEVYEYVFAYVYAGAEIAIERWYDVGAFRYVRYELFQNLSIVFPSECNGIEFRKQTFCPFQNLLYFFVPIVC